MATRPKAIIESHDGEEFSPITIAKNVLTDDGQNLQDILSDRKEDMMTPIIENSSSMFKVGQGDNVDYSENVVDGAYESCVLKGKSMVNCIQEPSSQDVVLPYAFEDGQSVTINDTKESGALGVELKGQTLVNLVPKKIIDYTASSDWDGYHQLVQNSKQSFDQWRALQDLKPNTKYYISCYVETFEVVNNEGYCLNNPSVESIFGDSMIVNGVGRYQWLSTTKSELTDEIFMALRCQNALARGAIKIRDIMIIEYQQEMENWDIPYFEGMASCKMPILQTVGANLWSSSAKYTCESSTGQTVTNDIRDIAKFFVGKTIQNGLVFRAKVNKENLTQNTTHNSSYHFGLDICFKCSDGSSVWSDFTTSRLGSLANSNNATMSFFNSKIIGKTITDVTNCLIFMRGLEGKFEMYDIEIYDSTMENIPTSYEPHKTSILSLPEEVVLRNIGSVEDTLNLTTGEYVQRIGEITLDGSDDEKWALHQITSYTTHTRFSFSLRDHNMPLGIVKTELKCDKFTWINSDIETEHIKIDGGGSRDIFVYILNSKLSTQDIGGLRVWLSQNPITVQYQLATPIVTKINLPSTLKSWNTTTHIYSEIPENTLYPILSHSNPYYPVILKPSTKYSIVANSYSNDHANSAINFNLGGATTSTTVGNRVTTITTPSTLTSEELVMSGRGNKLNNVMVIEGDVAGDEPYFEGLCDVKSPILLNIGKNLFNIDGEFIKSGYSNGIPIISHPSSQQTIEKIGGNTFRVITPPNSYNTGYGQFINVRGLDHITLSCSSIFSNSNTFIEIKVLCMYQGEELLTTVDYETSKSYINRVTTLSLSTSNQEYSTNIYVAPYDRIFVSFTGNWKSEMSGTFEFTMNDVYIRELLDNNEDYEPYKSNTTTFSTDDDKTIVLRSLPNEVCDTLNVETGEYIQRIGEVVLDGSEGGWGVSVGAPNSNYSTFTNNSIMKDVININGSNYRTLKPLCNKYPSYSQAQLFNVVDSSTPVTKGIAYRWNGYGLGVRNDGFNYDSEGLELFKQSLSQDPITVQYELATPITKTVDLSGYPFAYKNGHVQLSSGSIEQSLLPTVEYSVVTNRNGQVRSNQKMVEKHQKELDHLQAMILANMVETQYRQTLMKLKNDLKSEVRV